MFSNTEPNRKKLAPNILFNLTFLAVTVLASATTAPTKTQVNSAFYGPFGRGGMKIVGEKEV